MNSKQAKTEQPSGAAKIPIAVVGIGCRMPGGVDSPKAFWDAIVEGEDMISEVPSDRWSLESFHDPDQTNHSKMVTKRCGFVKDIDKFDNTFFKISPREASSMDPQQRHILEVTYEAFEDAGIIPSTLGEACGVYIGVGMMDYPIMIMETSLINPYTHTGVGHSAVANRISYAFDLRGPSYVVDTACVSSMTAMHVACNAIWDGECTSAVAGGCNTLLLPEVTVGFSALGVLSPEGKCCPFSDTAKGYVRSEGFGAFILKPLDAALADNDHVYAVIRGSAIAANGFSKSLTMPSAPAQEMVMKNAYQRCGVPLSSVQYVEAHGTGTPVGDPIEAGAIGRTFGHLKDSPLKIGSVKSNFGHSECAAGITAAIKVALMLEKRMLVPTINYNEPNPKIDLQELNLKVQTTLEPMKSTDDETNTDQYTIGLNSFGFAGAVAHMIFQNAPRPTTNAITAETAGWKFGDDTNIGRPIILPLSAKSGDALRDLIKKWLDFNCDTDALHVASWQATRREHHPYRMAIIANSSSSCRQTLEGFLEGAGSEAAVTGTAPQGKPKVCFVFPGQGQQWVDMGRKLYSSEIIFRETIDSCDKIFQRMSGWSLLEHCGLFKDENSTTEASPYTSVEDALGQVEVIQPAIMFIQVALFHQWQHWGVQPDVVVGHSLGEISAAYACGGLTLEEAVAVIYHRSHAQAKQEGTGRMAALRATREQAEKMCLEHDNLYIAAVNAPGAITIAGNCEVVATVVEQNPGKAKQLRVTCAFHTPEMDPIKEPFSTAMEGVVKSPFGKRTVPFYSTVTGEYYDASFGTDYWWSNIRNAVLFQPAIEAILQETKADVFLEIAASNTLLSSVKQIARGLDPKHPPTTINSSLRDKDDLHSIQRAIGTLFTSGVSLDWSCLTHKTAEWAPVPTYPWQHQSFWLETEERQKRRLGLDDRTFKGQSGNLTLEMFPFLADHVVGNRVVFPGAGYIEHMIQMTFSETETPALKNINFIRVLPWPEDSDSKKCTLKLGLEKDGAVMQVTCEGNEHSNAQTNTSSKEDNFLPLEKITERCLTEVTSEVFYERLQDVGLSYGPAFQMVEKMFLGDGEALAILQPVPDNKQRIQVAHLDATFQLVLSAVGSSSAMYLPVHIDSLEMSTESIPSGEKLLAYTRIIDCDSMLLSADITIATEEGVCLASVKGFQAHNFNGNHSDVPIESCIYTTQWQPVSANTLPTSVVTEVFKESNLHEKYGDELNAIKRAEEVLDDIEGVCVSYIRHAIETVPVEERAQGKSYAKYMNRFQTIAESKSSKSIPYNNIPSVLDKILEHVPELGSEVSLIKSLGDVFPDTLRDTQTAVPIMFCAEGLDRYFYGDDSLTTRLYYRAGAEAIVSAIREAAKHKKVVRVLELGARIGGLTRFITNPLKDMGEEKRMEYVFTDVSATFFQQAQENLKDFPFIQYKQIDIESDIDEQGFVPGSFDVIVCLDTLHAAVNVQRSTAYMSNLLSPDGLMFIIEGTNTHYLTELWFAALDVCWVFDDFRKERCWMDRQGWLDTMTQVGLKDIQSASSPNEFFHCIFAGRKSSLSERECLREVIKQDKMIIVRDESNRFSSEFLPFYHGEVQISTFSESKSLDLLFSEHSDSPMEVLYIYSDEDSKAHALLRLFQAVESYPEAVKRVWVLTKGANMDCTKPSGSLAVGLTRAVSNQIPGMSICAVDFDPENSLAENVQELLRLMDDSSLAEREIVLRKGRYVPRVMHQDLNNIKNIESQKWRVEQDLKGKAGKGASIDDLAFHDVQDIEVPSGHVKIKVKAAPLNFKDVMMALGLLEGLENDTHPSFGIECSGVVVEIGSRVSGLRIGDEVIAFGKGCFASHAICDAKLTVHKPDNLDFLESSSIGVVFVTAYLSLIERANLKKDETVLIHSACGGVGLAAIQIAKMIGAKIICTAGTEEKRSYLRKHVGIEMVSDSRTARFHDDVMEWTNGRGVDVILNSLSGKLLQTGISLLGQGGRFCEIGKRDILQSSSIPMGFFLENKSFNSCQVDVLMRQRPATVQGIMRKVVQLFDKSKLKPIPITVQPLVNLKETFRMMSKGAHIGKIVFEVPEGFQPAEIKPPLSQFKSNGTYIVTGGFGGIGQALSRWLCQNGAKHIVLVSRKGAKTAAAKRTVSYLKRNKVNLKEYSLDISNRQSVNKMLEKLRDDKRNPPIRGVFHLAGVIEEENLPEITADQMNRILGAKATGAKILHDLTQGDQLDVFFMLSSISTTWGHPAQPCYCAANAYLDALAEKRHIDGLPALSVQLAPVKGAGYLEDKGQTVKVLAMKGNHQLYVDEFLQVLGQLLSRGDLPTVCLANQEWGATQQFCYKSMLKFHHLAALGNKSSASDASSMNIADLETSIKSKMADLLCMSDDAIDVSQPMVNYGVDSLVALEMVNWATNQLGVTISQLDILGGITTAALLEKATEAR